MTDWNSLLRKANTDCSLAYYGLLTIPRGFNGFDTDKQAFYKQKLIKESSKLRLIGLLSKLL